jgi:hypothetical protein
MSTRQRGIAATGSLFDTRDRARRRLGLGFAIVCFLATVVGIIFLAVLLTDIWRDGHGRLSRNFLSGFPSRLSSRSGIKPALYGSLWTLSLTAFISFPLGVGTAVWLEEYAPKNRITRLIQINIANLAGVPSIVYGILGLALFVRQLALGQSVLAGALTLALLILPVIIIASQEAIRAVPNSLRLGAYALGATRWEAWYSHGDDPGAFACDRRGRAADPDRRAFLRAVCAQDAARFLHGNPGADLHMGEQASAGLSRAGCCRQHRSTGRLVDAERGGNFPAQSLLAPVLT